MSLLLLTTGCSFLGKRFMPHQTKLSFKFNQDYKQSYWYVVKSIPINCFPEDISKKYFIWGGHCTVRQETLPETINITYAKWVTPDEQEKRGFVAPSVNARNYSDDEIDLLFKKQEELNEIAKQKEWQAIDQEIPPEAWQTIQLDLAEIVKKYKGKLPERGEPEDWYSVDRSITITLELLKDGTVKVSDSYGWRYPYITHPN